MRRSMIGGSGRALFILIATAVWLVCQPPALSSAVHAPQRVLPCPPGPAPHHVSRLFGLAVGRDPFWAVPDGLWQGGQRLTLYMGDRHQIYAVRTRWGWSYKVLWELKAQSVPWVALQGWNRRTGQPIWFSTLPDRRATTHELLRANRSGALPGWRFFSGLIYVPTTGCYQLAAHWQGGHWTIPFAFERAA